MTEDLPFKIQIKLGPRSVDLSTTWLDENLKGKWSAEKESEYYGLCFEYEEDAVLTWWTWA